MLLGLLVWSPGWAVGQSLPVGWSELKTAAGARVSLRSAQVADTPPPSNLGGSFDTIIVAWSGGIVRHRTGELMVWGGGHGDYQGNEMYSWHLHSRIISVPSAQSGDANFGISCTSPLSETLADGKPAARHTYDGLAYNAPTDEMLSFSGSKACGAGDWSTSIWAFNFTTQNWTMLIPGGVTLQSALVNFGVASDYDRIGRKIYLQSTTQMLMYDRAANTLTAVGPTLSPERPVNSVLRIDPFARKALIIGAGGVMIFDLTTLSYSTPSTAGWPASTINDILNAPGPGCDFYDVTRQFVCWSGNNNVHRYTLATNHWDVETYTGAPPPDSPTYNGTFGRFRYVPSIGAFATMVDVDGGTWALRLADQPAVGRRLSLPAQTFVAKARPLRGVGPSGGTKHTTLAHNPINGRMYTMGGDFGDLDYSTNPTVLGGGSGGASDSYQQGLFSLDPAAAWTSTSSAVGWQREWGPCVAAGQIGVKYPDYIGWSWDDNRRIFWAVPGTFVDNSSPTNLCPNEQAGGSSDTIYKHTHILRFDPFLPPTSNRMATAGFTANIPGASNDTWNAHYDPITDRIYQPCDANSAAVCIYDPNLNTWSRVGLGDTYATGGSKSVWKNGSAIDIQNRRLWMFDGGAYCPAGNCGLQFGGHIVSFHLDTHITTDWGNPPCGGGVTCPGGAIDGCSGCPSTDVAHFDQNDGLIAWDSVNQVVGIFRHDTRTIHFLNPATSAWTSPAVVTSPTGLSPHARHAFQYDPYQAAFLLIGTTDQTVTDMFIYRYAGDNGILSASADVTPPTVSITAPTTGSTVSGSAVAVTATAADDIAVAGVQFRLDGANVQAEDPTAPYSITWDTTTTTDGSHALTAVARDTSNNTTTSSTVTVTVSNAGPPPGPISIFNFGEPSGTTTADATGNGHTGTLTGATLGSGVATFAGGTNRIALADGSPTLANLASESICATITATGFGGGNRGRIVDRGGITEFYVNNNAAPVTGGFTFDYTFADSTSVRASSPNGAITLNTATRICATWTGGTAPSGIHLYKNGTEVASYQDLATGGNPAHTSDTALVTLIGNRNTDLARGFAGTMDNVCLWSRVISAAEVTADNDAPATCGVSGGTAPAAPSNVQVNYQIF